MQKWSRKTSLSNKKYNRKNICCDILKWLIEVTRLLINIITCDGTWTFQFELSETRQWRTTASPRMTQPRKSRLKLKTMMIVVFDITVVIIIEWVPECWTFNQKYHNKALVHNRLSVKQLLADWLNPVHKHPPHSPDLAPCNFYMFSKVNCASKGAYF